MCFPHYVFCHSSPGTLQVTFKEAVKEASPASPSNIHETCDIFESHGGISGQEHHTD